MAEVKISDYYCQICKDLWLEPVTLPCNHTMCKECYFQNEAANPLQCPFCKKSVRTWTRKAKKDKSYIDAALWDKTQRLFPEEVKLRQEGESVDIPDKELDFSYVQSRQHYGDGELRKEYEQEQARQREEFERRQKQEEEASSDLLKSFLMEEEEANRLKNEKQKQEEEDAKLAALLSSQKSPSKFPTPRPTRAKAKGPPIPKDQPTLSSTVLGTPKRRVIASVSPSSSLPSPSTSSPSFSSPSTSQHSLQRAVDAVNDKLRSRSSSPDSVVFDMTPKASRRKWGVEGGEGVSGKEIKRKPLKVLESSDDEIEDSKMDDKIELNLDLTAALISKSKRPANTFYDSEDSDDIDISQKQKGRGKGLGKKMVVDKLSAIFDSDEEEVTGRGDLTPTRPKARRRRDVFAENSDTDDEINNKMIKWFKFDCCSPPRPQPSAPAVSRATRLFETVTTSDDIKEGQKKCRKTLKSTDYDLESSNAKDVVEDSFGEAEGAPSLKAKLDSSDMENSLEDSFVGESSFDDTMTTTIDSVKDANDNVSLDLLGLADDKSIEDQKTIEAALERQRAIEEEDRKMALKLQRQFEKEWKSELTKRPEGYGTRRQLSKSASASPVALIKEEVGARGPSSGKGGSSSLPPRPPGTQDDLVVPSKESSGDVASTSCQSLGVIDKNTASVKVKEEKEVKKRSCPHRTTSGSENCSYCILTSPKNTPKVAKGLKRKPSNSAKGPPNAKKRKGTI